MRGFRHQISSTGRFVFEAYTASKTLVHQLGKRRVADNIVNIIHGGVALAELRSESVHVAVVACIESANVASVGEFAINDGIFRVHIGLVKVISVLHMGTSDT
jgi:hypothetical protein